MTNAKEVAQTILQQLGGNKFLAMTGAKNLTYGTNKEGLPQYSFKFPMSKVANYCRITLEATDTYTMEFMKIRGTNHTSLLPITGVYCDQLATCFEGMTGLRTSLTAA